MWFAGRIGGTLPAKPNFQSVLSIKLLMKGSDGLRGILGVNVSYPLRAPVNQHLKSDDANLEPRNYSKRALADA
jgi:hypothetical protein